MSGNTSFYQKIIPRISIWRCKSVGTAGPSFFSVRTGRRESPYRYAAPGANRLADSRRPTRIALSIRVARRESICGFASPDANRSVDSHCSPPDANLSVDSRRPTRIALSIRVARRESLCRFAAAAANQCNEAHLFYAKT